MSDPFAELFRTLRVRGAVYAAQDFSAPWGMALPKRDYVQFHVALAGCCVVRHDAGELTLADREVVLFPNGSPHVVSDGSGGPVRDARLVVEAMQRGEKPFPGELASVRLLFGHFEFDRAARHPVLRNLPDVIHVAVPDGYEARLYEALAPLLSSEAESREPGSETIVERLAEIFLVRVLRAHFRAAAPGPSLLNAIFDPRLSAGIALIHTRWAEPLTLADLAKAAGMSRSTFAAAFRQATQITPMSYLAEWRLVKGRELLADQTRSIAQVAAACGHRSTEGFSRAFTRFYGQSPTSMRTLEFENLGRQSRS